MIGTHSLHQLKLFRFHFFDLTEAKLPSCRMMRSLNVPNMRCWRMFGLILISHYLLWTTNGFLASFSRRSNNKFNYHLRKWHYSNPRTSGNGAEFASKPRITSEEVVVRLLKQLEKLREKDRQAKVLTSEDLQIVFEDEHLVIVEKPSGVLSVPSEEGIPSLAQTVFETVDHNVSSYDRMVVHRLGMETSGLVVFAKSMEALRGLNTLFRTRQICRQYEVLVVGHVAEDNGIIDMPLMRDYEHPPYMRISTPEHQRALLDLDPLIVGKKLLEAPKPSQTKFEVVNREYLDPENQLLPVTRLTLTSITGRTQQLNVHCAAFGHPIVGDKVYGYGGEAASNGGLELTDVATATIELEKQISQVCISANMKMCAHAKYLEFGHPVLPNDAIVKVTSKAPF